jgi:2-dehydro-3-deoxyphosphogluconate aldolase/(4S)-4-hydroxy-2-oxoglutarate aldolase
MHAVLNSIGDVGGVAIDRAGDAVPLGKALLEGGLPAVEVTLRTTAAEDAIRALVSGMPGIRVEAGTALTTEQAKRAIGAGAKFVVSPGLDPAVVNLCMDMDVPVIPGCCTPTEVLSALALGLEVVKFFPAEAMGGAKTIKMMAGPYPSVKFIPTGGIGAANLSEYLSLGNVLACGGSWMAHSNLIKAGDFGQITRLTRETVAIASRSRRAAGNENAARTAEQE